MAATPVVTLLVMSLNKATTTIAITASPTIVSMVSSNRAVLITFVLLGFLTVILGSVGQVFVVVVPAPLDVPVPVILWLCWRLVLEEQPPMTLKVVRNLVHVKGRSWVKWIDVLIIREPILHRVREDVSLDLFKLIIHEDPAGSKRVFKATTMLVEFPHAMEYVGRFLATTVLSTEVHVLELLVHVLMDLVPWISVVP